MELIVFYFRIGLLSTNGFHNVDFLMQIQKPYSGTYIKQYCGTILNATGGLFLCPTTTLRLPYDCSTVDGLGELGII
jgi:hypothetical protein